MAEHPTFRFKDEINYRRFFWFPRDLVKSSEWSQWPTSSQAVFPVLLYFMDAKKGTCFPSMETIGILCGRDRKTVSEGIEYLRTRPIPLKRSARITERGRMAYSYSYPVPVFKRGFFFPFRHCVIDGGNWSLLTPSAQALYVTMRTYSGVTLDDSGEIFGEDYEGELKDDYAIRGFEFCRAEPDVLGTQSGIKTWDTFKSSIASLTKRHLIERAPDSDIEDGEAWKVFLTPPIQYKSDFLNEQIEKKYPLSKFLSKRLSKSLSKSLPKEDQTGLIHDVKKMDK